MPPDPKVHVGVAAWIEHPDGRILMQRRAGVNADGFGMLSVPGGWLDFGETPLGAAYRETLEETGVTVVAQDVIDVVTFRDDLDRWVVGLFVQCRYVSGVPTVREPDKASWCGWRPMSMLTDADIYGPLRTHLERRR